MNDKPLRLLADGMLGTLAKWLRLLGYDTAYDNVAADPELVKTFLCQERTPGNRSSVIGDR